MQEVAETNGVLGEDEYKGSNVFLKGTQSANPHNDYSQHFIDTGQRAQNFIRDVGEEGVCVMVEVRVWDRGGWGWVVSKVGYNLLVCTIDPLW